MSANRPFDDDDPPGRGYVDRRADPNRADREISLGTPTILGIFFVLALAFAAVFGLGYTMGHKSGQNAQATIADPAGMAVSSAAKPNAGSSGAHPLATSVSQPADQTPASAPPPQTATVSLNPPPASKSATPADRAIVGDRIPAAAPQPATANLQPATSFMVQVAAVHTQEVADIEVAALKKQGYDVVIRHEPQDNLLHVQIGPFPDRKDAEAMRARVLADGFNAIVK